MRTEDLIPYLILSPLPRIIFISKIFVLIFSLFLILIIIYFLIKTSFKKYIFLQDLIEFLTFKSYGVRKIGKNWAKIIERLEGGEEEAKLAIIEADSLLNEILKRMGYKGETLGERLEQLTSANISNLEEVLEAHKIRNNIIHDPSYKLTLDQARRILAIYEKAFEGLEAF